MERGRAADRGAAHDDAVRNGGRADEAARRVVAVRAGDPGLGDLGPPDELAGRPVDRVVGGVLVPEPDERPVAGAEEVGCAGEVEVVPVRLVGLIRPADVPVVELERDDRFRVPPVAGGAAGAVSGPDEHQPRSRVDARRAPHVAAAGTGRALAFCRRRHGVPALRAGGGVERSDAGGLAVPAVVHVGAEDHQPVRDDRRRLDLARVLVVAAPSDLVLPPQLPVFGAQRVERLPPAEVHRPHALGVRHRGRRHDLTRVHGAVYVRLVRPARLPRLDVDGIEVAGPVADVHDAVHDRRCRRDRVLGVEEPDLLQILGGLGGDLRRARIGERTLRVLAPHRPVAATDRLRRRVLRARRRRYRHTGEHDGGRDGSHERAPYRPARHGPPTFVA